LNFWITKGREIFPAIFFIELRWQCCSVTDAAPAVPDQRFPRTKSAKAQIGIGVAGQVHGEPTRADHAALTTL
jgi:hypothetical protein